MLQLNEHFWHRYQLENLKTPVSVAEENMDSQSNFNSDVESVGKVKYRYKEIPIQSINLVVYNNFECFSY